MGGKVEMTSLGLLALLESRTALYLTEPIERQGIETISIIQGVELHVILKSYLPFHHEYPSQFRRKKKQHGIRMRKIAEYLRFRIPVQPKKNSNTSPKIFKNI
jgi:hypothetical protein